jgi:hypothetical protein
MQKMPNACLSSCICGARWWSQLRYHLAAAIPKIIQCWPRLTASSASSLRPTSPPVVPRRLQRSTAEFVFSLEYDWRGCVGPGSLRSGAHPGGNSSVDKNTYPAHSVNITGAVKWTGTGMARGLLNVLATAGLGNIGVVAVDERSANRFLRILHDLTLGRLSQVTHSFLLASSQVPMAESMR